MTGGDHPGIAPTGFLRNRGIAFQQHYLVPVTQELIGRGHAHHAPAHHQHPHRIPSGLFLRSGRKFKVASMSRAGSRESLPARQRPSCATRRQVPSCFSNTFVNIVTVLIGAPLPSVPCTRSVPITQAVSPFTCIV